MRSSLKAAFVAVAALGAVFAAHAASAANYNFTFSDPTDGVTATGTLDVVGGAAQSGSGTLTSPFWTGADAITLITPTTATNYYGPGPGQLEYTTGGGTDLNGDVYFPIDNAGLVFSVATNPALDVGLNIWSNGGGSYTAFISGNSGIYNSYNGTLTTSAAGVPEPATWALTILGFGALGAVLRAHRRTDREMALLRA